MRRGTEGDTESGKRERGCDLGIRVTKLGFDLKNILEFRFVYFKLKIFFKLNRLHTAMC